MSSAPEPSRPKSLSTERFELLRKFADKLVPFNRVLGLRLLTAELGQATLRLDFRDELVGNFITGVLHGGVISATLDVVGACAVMTTYMADNTLHGMGTVDMRVDYLRPGKGRYFIASGTVMRPGRILGAARMDLTSDSGELIAMGTAVYRVSRKEQDIFMNV